VIVGIRNATDTGGTLRCVNGSTVRHSIQAWLWGTLRLLRMDIGCRCLRAVGFLQLAGAAEELAKLRSRAPASRNNLLRETGRGYCFAAYEWLGIRDSMFHGASFAGRCVGGCGFVGLWVSLPALADCQAGICCAANGQVSICCDTEEGGSCHVVILG